MGRGNFEGDNGNMSCGRYTQNDSAGDITGTMRMPIEMY